MGQLTQTTAQVQTILDNSDAANVGKTSLTDSTDTTAVAVKKSGFYSLGASSSNAPSTDRAILISAVRDTTATGEIRYGQVAITESNGMWWNRDDGGTLGTWYEAVSTAGTQTLTNKTLTSPILTTPQLNDTSADHQYIFAVSELVADRTVTMPLLTGNDTFVFEAHTQTLTNKTLTSPVFNTGVSGTAVLDDDTFATATATTLATSESIKAYVDSQVGSFDTLAEVLAQGNTTGSTNIVVTAGQSITTDTVAETTAAAGVTIDSLKIKDGQAEFANDKKALFGAAGELEIYSDGTDSFIKETHATGSLFVYAKDFTVKNNDGSESMLNADVDGGVQLFHNNAQKLATTTTGVGVTGTLTAGAITIDSASTFLSDLTLTGANYNVVWDSSADALEFADNAKAVFGAGSDLQIYHDGTHSYVQDAGTGNLILKGSHLNLRDANNDLYLEALQDGAVEIRYDNSVKLATTSTGADITGTLTADGLTVESAGTIQLTQNTTAEGDLLGRIEFHDEDAVTGDGGVVRLEAIRGGDVDAPDFQIISTTNGGVLTNRLFLDSATGNIGIGTASPDQKLDINSGNIRLETSGSQYVFASDDNNVKAGHRYHASSNYVATYTNGSEAMRIDSSGNVQIGSTSSDGRLKIAAASGASAAAELTLWGNNAGGFGGTNIAKSKIDSKTDGTAYGSILRMYTNDTSNNYQERMRIDSSGNVGIGTTSPSAPIHIQTSHSSTDVTAANTNSTMVIGNSAAGNGVYNAIKFSANQQDMYIMSFNNSTQASRRMGFFLGSVAGDATTDERLSILGDGKVGIGTSSPARNLSVVDSAAPHIQLAVSSDQSASNGFEIAYDTTANYLAGRENVPTVFYTNNAERMRIDSSGQVGIGTSSPRTLLHVHGAAGDPGKLALSEGGAESRIFATRNSDTNGDLHFQTEISGNIATRMKIDYSGNVQVGQTVGTLFGQTSDNGVSLGGTGAIQAACATTVLFLNRLDASGGQVVRFDTNGTQVGSISTTSSATAYNTSSDQRLKDNIVDAPSASDDIDAIQVRSFDWKADGSHQKYGMVAQELVTVAPEAVSEGETEEDMMGVDYSKLVPMLIKEVQQLRARVAQLEGEN